MMTGEVQQDEDAYRALCARAEGTNVNATTLLTTDYFNHFNEAIMLIGLVPDMPEMLDEVKAWHPISYQEHFEASSIADRDLAIEAYAHVPERYKKPFETTITQMNELVADAVATIGDCIEKGEDDMMREVAESHSRALQRLVDVAGAIVHGSENVMAQNQIDELIGD